MASNISTANIDTTFPVAGQDNDSQGFRDNFNATKNNFTEAKTEIEALQTNKAFQSAALVAVWSRVETELYRVNPHLPKGRGFSLSPNPLSQVPAGLCHESAILYFCKKPTLCI